MTLPAYSGRHATFDATTVLPVLPTVPPSGAPPGPPASVTTAAARAAPPAGLERLVPAVGAPAPVEEDRIADPGRPVAVEVAFWLTAVQAVVGSLSWMATGHGLGLLDSPHPADRTFFAVLGLVGIVGHLLWLVLAWRVRGGATTARTVFVNVTVAGLLGSIWFCSIGFWLPLPGVVLLGTILLLLSRPSSVAWCRR